MHNLLKFSFRQHVPCILQSEAAECGLACLAMILGYYKHQIDLVSLRQRHFPSANGISLRSLIEIANHCNLASRPLRLELASLTELQTPCILHWDMNHFVVLVKVKRNTVIINDPAIGKRALKLKELGEHFTGVAVEIIPTNNFRPTTEIRPVTLQQFVQSARGLKRTFTIIFALSLLLQCFSILSPFYMQTVVDDIVLQSDKSLLVAVAIGFALLVVIETICRLTRGLVSIYLSNSLSLGMSFSLFRKLIQLPSHFFSKRHIGDVVSRFGSIDAVRDILSNGIVTALVDGVLVLVTLGVMLVYDPWLALLVIIFTTLYALLRFATYQPMRRLNTEAISAKANTDAHFIETVRAIQTLKAFNQEQQRQLAWQDLFATTLNKNIELSRWGISIQCCNFLLFGIQNIVVVYFAALAIMSGQLSIGMLFAFMSYKSRFENSVNTLIEQLFNYKLLQVHLERLAEIVHTKSESISPPQVTSNDTQYLQGAISVSNLSFRYSETDPWVFEKLNLQIEAGTVVAIVGASGSGKSTLVKVLMGLIRPTEGVVRADGLDITHLPHYRQQISCVLQDDQLLNGSILQNVACFDTHVNFEQVQKCCKLANVHQEIVSLPMQYNTLLGDTGTGLSGGQLQRIMLARALYTQPSLLFLDEATSNLDVKSESIVNANIKSLKITRIVVAHRPQTIAAADRVIELGKQMVE